MEARKDHAELPWSARPVESTPPRIVDRPAFLVAGMSERHTPETMEEIALLWRRFMAHIGNVRGKVGDATYGICFNSDLRGNFDYLAGVEVQGAAHLPSQLTSLAIARQRYAVFTHRGHISAISRSWAEIFGRLLSDAGLLPAGAPAFERYDQRFDPSSGSGEVEIWVPLKSLPRHSL